MFFDKESRLKRLEEKKGKLSARLQHEEKEAGLREEVAGLEEKVTKARSRAKHVTGSGFVGAVRKVGGFTLTSAKAGGRLARKGVISIGEGEKHRLKMAKRGVSPFGTPLMPASRISAVEAFGAGATWYKQPIVKTAAKVKHKRRHHRRSSTSKYIKVGGKFVKI